MKRVDHLHDDDFADDLKNGSQIPKNYDDSLPFVVNECIYKISVPVSAVFEEGDDPCEVLRQQLNIRGEAFQKAIEQLLFKYSWVCLVGNVINTQKKPFILYLQDFGVKNQHYAYGTVITAESYEGMLNLKLLAEKYPEVIFVYVGIPFEASELDYMSLNDIRGEHLNVFRVDCGKNWLETVKLYITQASCVFVSVKDLGRGTQKEIDFLKQQNLLDKTVFFSENEKLISDYVGCDVKFSDKLFSDVGVIYTKNKNCRTKNRLPTSTLWVTGNLRKELEECFAEFEKQSLDSYRKNEKHSPVAQLDDNFFALGQAIVLEDFAKIVGILCPIIQLISFYSPKVLKNRNGLIKSFVSYFVCFSSILWKMRRYTPFLENNVQFVSKIYTHNPFKNLIKSIACFFFVRILRLNVKIRRSCKSA